MPIQTRGSHVCNGEQTRNSNSAFFLGTCKFAEIFSYNAMQVKLDLSLLEDILDDVDFCCKLAKEESVIILPGEEGWVASVELH